jgi:hypothetical protein
LTGPLQRLRRASRFAEFSEDHAQLPVRPEPLRTRRGLLLRFSACARKIALQAQGFAQQKLSVPMTGLLGQRFAAQSSGARWLRAHYSDRFTNELVCTHALM